MLASTHMAKPTHQRAGVTCVCGARMTNAAEARQHMQVHKDWTVAAFTVPIPVELLCEPGWTQFKMHMTFVDMTAEVKAGQKRIGDMRGCIGGGVEVHIETDDENHAFIYYLSPRAIWEAVRAAHVQRVKAREAQRGRSA